MRMFATLLPVWMLSVGNMQLLAKVNHAWHIKGSKGPAFKPQDPDAKTCPVQYSLHGTLLYVCICI